MSSGARVGLLVVGLIVLFGGIVARDLEDEYGSNTNFAIQGSPGGNVVVLAVDEQAGASTPVFEGSEEEAMAYIEQRRLVGKDFLVPGLAIAAGALLVLASVFARPGKDRTDPKAQE